MGAAVVLVVGCVKDLVKVDVGGDLAKDASAALLLFGLIGITIGPDVDFCGEWRGNTGRLAGGGVPGPTTAPVVAVELLRGLSALGTAFT